MVHQWIDVGRGKLVRTQLVDVSDRYKPLLGIKETVNGMGWSCDGNDCGPAPSNSYIIHVAPCMMLRSSRTDEENAALNTEECG